ncbi:MAG TPA: hybrid sensor histidine kinase/response regulator [Vicinamibacterales bacterium]|nr:hybrid sensor histidine kinase/response regulator [Vicinamibacterales bacterium]
MLNLAAIVGITGATLALLVAAFSLGMARSPFWAERRQFALVAATAAGYCAFDVALVLNLSPGVIAAAVQVALAFGIAQCVAWIRYLAAADGRPLRKAEQRMVAVGVVIALAGFIPGLLLTRDLFVVRVDWLGVTYRTPQPTLVGLACYGYLAAALIVIGAGAARRWSESWQARLPILGVVTLGLLAANDTLTSAGLIRMPLLLDIGSVSIIAIVGVMHERRFAANVHSLERASAKLKREVEERAQALLDAQAALAASERLAGLGRLTASVAHEINNPISVVQHSLERIRSSSLTLPGVPEELPRSIDSGLAATDRIVRIVRRLLDAGRVSSADTVHAEPFLVAPVVRAAVVMVGRHLKGVQVSIQTDECVTALGDAGLLSQALENLLVNAAQALDGRRDSRIRVRVEHLQTHVRISVTDNGPGIPKAVRGRLFEPFVTTKAIGKGSGLGLAVSKGLMRSQHGDLALASTSGLGTEMYLQLPWTDREPAAKKTPPPPVASAVRRTMLIIEDEVDVRDMLQDMCNLNFDVIAVASVADGLAAMDRGYRPDVVLCDLTMPGGGANDWLGHWQNADVAVAARTVIITGGPMTPEDDALVVANADRVLYKPFTMARLQAVVGEVTAS